MKAQVKFLISLPHSRCLQTTLNLPHVKPFFIMLFSYTNNRKTKTMCFKNLQYSWHHDK